tara:strand:- start:1783 stop:2883 length:1101 start_codon:yes stop_codon:yes gene_type:complete
MEIEKYPILYRGTVKNVRQVKACTEDSAGIAIFEFSSDSSIKDYGKLPFKTPFKGEDLCAMAVQSFLDIEALGINTVFIEKLNPTAIMVQLVDVIDPQKKDLRKILKNRLVPLECIIRNVVTATSSARKRMENGSIHPLVMGLSKLPDKYPVILPKMFFDGSTKIGTTDDYLPWDQLKSLSGESTELLNEIELQTRRVGQYALRKGSALGLVINDFKLEWALNESSELMLADVPLAMDEITSAYCGSSFTSLDELNPNLPIFTPAINHHQDSYVNVSKQIYRDHYTAAHPDWCRELEEAKSNNLSKSKYPVPNPPPDTLINLVSEMFAGLRNLWVPKNKRGARPLTESTRDYKEWAKHYYQIESQL